MAVLSNNGLTFGGGYKPPIIISANSDDKTSVTFTLPKSLYSSWYRIGAILFGNANGTPLLECCSIFSNGNVSEVAISNPNLTISGSESGDNYLITIGNVQWWSTYHLLLTQ